MSYILDALKKSEKQRPPGPVPDLFTIQGPQPSASRRPPLLTLLGAAGLVGVIGLTAWAWLGGRQSQPPRQEPVAALAPVPRPVAVTVRPVPGPAVQPAQKVSAPRVAAAGAAHVPPATPRLPQASISWQRPGAKPAPSVPTTPISALALEPPAPSVPAVASPPQAPSVPAAPPAVTAVPAPSPAPTVSAPVPGPVPASTPTPPPAATAAASSPAAAPVAPPAASRAVEEAAPAPPPAVVSVPEPAQEPEAVPPPEPVPPADGRAVGIAELPESVRLLAAKVAISGHVWSEDAGLRMLTVQNHIVREGGEASPGVRLEEITQTGAVFSSSGWRFRVEGF